MNDLHAWVGRTVPILAVVGASAVVGAGVAGEYTNVAGLLVAIVIAGLCLLYPALGVNLFIISAFSLEWLVSMGALPSGLKFVQDVLSLGLLAVLAVTLSRRSDRRISLGGGRWLVVFAFVVAAGWMVNLSPVSTAIVGFRNIAIFVPIALVLANGVLEESQVRTVLRTVMVLCFLQIPVALVQFLFMRSGTSGDAVGGTLGMYASGVLTVLVIGVSTLVIGDLLYGVTPRSVGLFRLAALMVIPALNETKAFFVVAPLILGAIMMPRLKRGFITVVLVTTIVAAMIGVVSQTYEVVYGTAGIDATTLAFQQETQGDTMAEGGVMRRLPSVVFAFSDIMKEPSTAALGYGVGSLTRSDTLQANGVLTQKYGDLFRNPVLLVRLLFEYGLLGVTSFVLFLVSVFTLARRLEKRSDVSRVRAMAVGLQGFTMTMAIMSIYTGTFTTDALACVFWLLVGLCTFELLRLDRAGTIGDVSVSEA